MVSLAQIVSSAALGAFIGYFTNALAIRSLFRPLEPRWYTLGWQGVIPKNRARLADNVARVVGEDLLSHEYLVAQIERPALQEHLGRFLHTQLEKLLDQSPMHLLERLPAGGLERLIERGVKLFAAWRRDEASLEFKHALLTFLERQVRQLKLGEVLGDEAAEDLAAGLDELLAREATRAELARVVEARTLAFLQRDASLEEVLPDELREAFRQGLRREIPALLERLAAWLSSSENAGDLSARLFEALVDYAEREGGLRRWVGELGLRFFGEQIEAAIAEWLPRVAREYLARPDTRERVERHLVEGIDSLLDKPLGEWVGSQSRPLAKQIGRISAAWMTSAQTRVQVRDLVMDQYRRWRQHSLEALVPDSAWADIRRQVLGLMRIEDEEAVAWGLGPWLCAKAAASKGPLRRWLSLSPADQETLVVWGQVRATELLQREVPVLLGEIDIAHMVREQVLGFDLLRVEDMVRSLISDQLRYIELLGAVLGGLVGISLPFLYQLF